MSQEIRIPDIGDFDAVKVIEVLVKQGDIVEADQALITLESDKASMDVPSPYAGVIEWLNVEVGDVVREGDLIAGISVKGEGGDIPAELLSETQPAAAQQQMPAATAPVATHDLLVPDIGDFSNVEVIEVAVKVGDPIALEQSLITLETDKASMEVPSEYAGILLELNVQVGDRVSAGSLIGRVQSTEQASTALQSTAAQNSAHLVAPAPKATAQTNSISVAKLPAASAPQTTRIDERAFRKAYAGPAVRKFARELGADLGRIQGSGKKGRIVLDDVKAFVKQMLNHGTTATISEPVGSGIPAIPAVDFSKFGETESMPLSRINILTGEHMTRCWLNIPHVTQHDWADISDLEAFRQAIKKQAEKEGVRVTMLAFLMKTLVSALKAYPRFNASLAQDGKSLILKKYFHIGIAVDTSNGLVVPVIRDVDQKGIFELSRDLSAMSQKARDGKLSPQDMSGGCITISSLGGIGGTHFTPVVNAPEVAILGVGRSEMQPRWDGQAFQPRLMLPLSLSYDHRVIDGANGARFIRHIAESLEDMRRNLL